MYNFQILHFRYLPFNGLLNISISFSSSSKKLVPPFSRLNVYLFQLLFSEFLEDLQLVQIKIEQAKIAKHIIPVKI